MGLTPAIGRDFEQAEDSPRDRASRSSAIRSGGGVTVRIRTSWAARSQSTSRPSRSRACCRRRRRHHTARKFPNTEIWTLLRYSEQMGPPACRGCRHISVVARLKDGVTPIESGGRPHAHLSIARDAFSDRLDRPRPAVTPVRDYFLGPVKTPLYLLWGAVALLLLIACANIANLLLIRASEREEEIAVRRALGVSPARMLRQLLTEAVVLAVIGGAAGTAVAFWATALLTTNGPAEIPRLSEVSPDARVLAYAFALSLATGVLFGLAPARMLVARPNVVGIGSRRTTSGPGAWRYRAALIAGNVALCVLLLSGPGCWSAASRSY